jgi:hypothetical protein
MDRRELLFQDEYWVDGPGRIHRVADMDIKHAQNTYRYLTMADRALAHLDLLISSSPLGPGPSGDAATDAYEGELARLEAARSNPIGWIKELPLLVALQERGWGNPEPKPKPKPRHRELLVVLKVKIGHDADANPVEWDIEEAVKALPYDIEITDVR